MSFCFGLLVKEIAHTQGFEHGPSGLKKIAHTQGFEPEASGLKSKHLTTRPKKSELCDLRAETRELSRGKKSALSHNTCLTQV